MPSSKVWPPLNLRQLPNLLFLPRLSATYTVRDMFAQQCYLDAVQKQCFRKATRSKSKIPGAYPNPFSNPTQLALKSCGRILRDLNRNSGFLLWKVGPCLPCWFMQRISPINLHHLDASLIMDLNWLHVEKTILSLYWLLFQDSSLVVSAPPLPLSEVLGLVGALLYKCK